MTYCIVTIYKSQNCGSFLQAYALGKAVESLGGDVCYYRYRDRENKKIIKMIIKSLIKFNFRSVKRLLKQQKTFKSLTGSFHKTTSKTLPFYILGSDTIWDISSPFFGRRHSIFFGEIFTKSRVFSYAPSIGYANKNDFLSAIWIKEALAHLDCISVREKRARDVISQFTDKPISLVCDPTLLIPKEIYCKLAGKESRKGTLLIYFYGKIPDEYKSELRDIASSENLKLVSFGSSNPWCDTIEPFDPVCFLALYRDSEYVFTNTFHGTVFAHIYNKRFAVAEENKPKIQDFLAKMGTSEKSVSHNKSIKSVFDSEFDFDEINRVMSEERSSGISYLAECTGLK